MVIEFLWLKGVVPQFSNAQRLRISTTAPFIEVIPEIFFAYYLAYVGLVKMVSGSRSIVLALSEILLVLFGCILVERVIGTYLIIPYFYHNQVQPSPLLEPMRLISVLLYMTFSSGLLVSIKSVRNQLAAKEREKNLVKEKLETELKYLKNQINPHFLFNTLNNIYALTRKKSDTAPEAVMKLSELLSFMLYESGKDTIPVKDEVKIIEDYLDLERLRYTDRLTVTFDKQIDNLLEPVAPLLLIPLVENAFKHGISESRFASFVHINLVLQNKMLACRVANSVENGKKESNNSHIGLSNIRRQLELLYNEHTIHVETAKNTYAVEIKINLHSYGKI